MKNVLITERLFDWLVDVFVSAARVAGRYENHAATENDMDMLRALLDDESMRMQLRDKLDAQMRRVEFSKRKNGGG